MAVSRSPNYPALDLGASLEAIKVAYKAEGRSKMARSVLAHHLGYTSLNGRALAKIGAIRAYGLIEGREDELRISPDAIVCIEAPEGSHERVEAMTRCATNPSIFKEIAAAYATLPSEQNLRFFLVKKDFSTEAAGKAASNYLTTMRLVSESAGAYNASSPIEDSGDDMQTVGFDMNSAPKMPSAFAGQGKSSAAPVNASEREYLRGSLSREVSYRLIVDGEMGPRQLGKLIKLLEAQKAVLDDDDDEPSEFA